MLHAQRVELRPATAEPLDDAIVVVSQDHLDEGRTCFTGDLSKSIDELRAAQELRDDHIVSSSEVSMNESDCQLAGNDPGLLDRPPLAKVAAKIIELNYKSERMLLGVTISECRLANPWRSVQHEQHASRRYCVRPDPKCDGGAPIGSDMR
jgi:hypothetical protein